MYGYRPKEDLAVTRLYTEQIIYNAMRRMHESDVALREAIEKNPDQEIIFIQGTTTGAVMPRSPNKILLTETTTLKLYKRLLPVGFQTDVKTRLKSVTEHIDTLLAAVQLKGASAKSFKIKTTLAHDILHHAENEMAWREDCRKNTEKERFTDLIGKTLTVGLSKWWRRYWQGVKRNE